MNICIYVTSQGPDALEVVEVVSQALSTGSEFIGGAKGERLEPAIHSIALFIDTYMRKVWSLTSHVLTFIFGPLNF